MWHVHTRNVMFSPRLCLTVGCYLMHSLICQYIDNDAINDFLFLSIKVHIHWNLKLLSDVAMRCQWVCWFETTPVIECCVCFAAGMGDVGTASVEVWHLCNNSTWLRWSAADTPANQSSIYAYNQTTHSDVHSSLCYWCVRVQHFTVIS